ncbi:MAG TPA: RES domain-containing protein [Usitatibacter sp.]|nr:RES domain-containing protein [Usitatibacter sp.]
MTPLPAGPLLGWRLDLKTYAATWDSGIGAEKFGGRWNSRGVRAVYAAVDPATAILELAVHKGFPTLDTVSHVLTAFELDSLADAFIVRPKDVPNPAWLWPGTPGAGQQQFGDALLAKHPFLLIPSAVSHHSWNLIFSPTVASGKYKLAQQHAFALDPRLNPSPSPRP